MILPKCRSLCTDEIVIPLKSVLCLMCEIALCINSGVAKFLYIQYSHHMEIYYLFFFY